MTEQINLEGDNILDDYKDDDGELSEDEAPVQDVGNIVIKLPEVKGPEYYATLTKIKEYKRLFPEECENVDIKNENKLTYEDLLNKVEECKVAAANRGNNSMHRMGLKTILSVAEIHVAPKMGMDLAGYTNTVMTDEELLRTLDEMALLQDWTTKYIPPEQRLLFGLGTIALRVNASNKAAKKELHLPENKGNYDDL